MLQQLVGLGQRLLAEPQGFVRGRFVGGVGEDVEDQRLVRRLDQCGVDAHAVHASGAQHELQQLVFAGHTGEEGGAIGRVGPVPQFQCGAADGIGTLQTRQGEPCLVHIHQSPIASAGDCSGQRQTVKECGVRQG